MSSKPISRASLQGMQEANKQRYIDGIIDAVVTGVTSAANTGKLSYIYDVNNIVINSINSAGIIQMHEHNIIENKPLYKPTISTEELVAALKRKFPDCDVSYEERWLDDNKISRKGILINWS